MRSSTAWKSIRLLILTLSLGWLGGCGDDPQTQMQQAQISLSNNKPDLALQYATAVLDAQPGHRVAMMVKARAQIMLAQLSDAKASLDELIRLDSENAEIRRLHIMWAFRELERLRNRSDFVTQDRHKDQFDEVLNLASEEADWLAMNQEDAAEVAYLRGPTG